MSESSTDVDQAIAALSTHQRQYLRLAQFNTWYNGELYRHAGTLSDADRKLDRGAFFKSIHNTLDHILLCDRMWLGRIERSSLPFPSLSGATLVSAHTSIDSGVSQDWDELCAARAETDRVIEAFVRELTPRLLDSDLHYKNSKDIDFCMPLWHVVSHFFNHGTHHRGQVTTLLMQAGIDPGTTDFIIAAMMPFPDLAG